MPIRFWVTLANLCHPGHFLPGIRKVTSRFEPKESSQALEWIHSIGPVTTETYCRKLDPELWRETQSFGESLEMEASRVLRETPREVGGGGDYLLLYFLVRVRKPAYCLETGVAAGWTSHAMLRGMMQNGAGHLFSSDLPYFRLKDSKKYVGALVPESLRWRWTLDTGGDEKALPRFLSTIPNGRLSLFHYDSDKSYSSRARALGLIRPSLSADAIIVMDDIQDNLFFRDLVTQQNLTFTIIEFHQKYLGIIEDAGAQLSLTQI